MNTSVAHGRSARSRRLALVLALSVGCAGARGKPMDECPPGYGMLSITITLGDEYTESVKENLDDEMRLWIDHLDEEPDGSEACVALDGDKVGTVSHDLDRVEDLLVPAGWLCGRSNGGFTPTGHADGYGYCDGDLEFVEVGECRKVQTEMVVTCQFYPDEGERRTEPLDLPPSGDLDRLELAL